MAADRRPAYRKSLGELAGGQFTPGQQADQLSTRRVGEGGQGVHPRYVTYRLHVGERFQRGAAGHIPRMTVTDPDVPDPLNDPRTLQADPGASAQGADLASTEDDAEATGDDEPGAGRDQPDDAGGGDVTGGAVSESPRP
jgi:hypothetical protein